MEFKKIDTNLIFK